MSWLAGELASWQASGRVGGRAWDDNFDWCVVMSNLAELENQAFTVSDFVKQTNDFFNRLGFVLIKGEISQFSVHTHLYFAIKDEQSVVNCIMFAGNAKKLDFQPQDGQKVIVYGTNSLYGKAGKFSINVAQMELAGLGHIMEQLRLLDLRLAQEGVYSIQRPFPALVENVAVVTSTEGRVIDDIRTNVFRRNPLVNLYEFPCLVQGPDAPASIVNALYQAYQAAESLKLDVIIVGRGGGSFEDLLCFSDERVVRAVAQSPVVIISAVGHDEDRPLCDKSADYRVSTPTAAAEAVTSYPYVKFIERLEVAVDDLYNKMGLLIDSYDQRISNCYAHLERSPIFAALGYKDSQLNQLCYGLDNAMKLVLSHRQQKINYLVGALEQQGVNERLLKYNHNIEQSLATLNNFASAIDERSNRLNQTIDYLFSKSVTDKLNSYANYLEQSLIKSLDKSLQDKSERLNERLVRAEERLVQIANSKLRELSEHKAQLISGLEVRLEQAINNILQGTRVRLSLQEKLLELGEAYPNDLPSYFDTKLMHGAKDKVSNAISALEKVEDAVFAYEDRVDSVQIKLEHSFDALIAPQIKDYDSEIERLITRLQALNPLYQLERGLSLTTLDGMHSVSGKDINVGDEIITILKDYQVRSTVSAIEFKTLSLDKNVKDAQEV